MLLAARLLGSLPGSLEQAREPAHCWKPSWLQTCPPPGTTAGHFHIRGYKTEVIHSSRVDEETERQEERGENQTWNWIERNLEFRGHICEGGRGSTLTKGSCKTSNFRVYPKIDGVPWLLWATKLKLQSELRNQTMLLTSNPSCCRETVQILVFLPGV